MGRTKPFDCVEMKRRIQEEHGKRFAGLPDHEVAVRIVRELESSRDPIAVWYRACLAREGVAAK